MQGFFAKLRKNLAPEQFKSLHRHARVKVLLNCSAGIKIKGVCPSSIVEINYDMRSAYCSLDIQSSSPERRQTKDCGEPNLYEVTAEKDAVRIPQTRSRLTIFKPFGHALKIRAFQTNKNRRMYSDRMCKTKASSTQGSFCKPINLIFFAAATPLFSFFRCRKQRKFGMLNPPQRCFGNGYILPR